MESQLKRIKRAQALTWRAQLVANPFKANLCLPVCFVRCFNRRIVIDLRHFYLSTISNEFSRRILQISVKRLLHSSQNGSVVHVWLVRLASERMEPGDWKGLLSTVTWCSYAPSRTNSRTRWSHKTTSPYRLNIFSRLSAIPASFSSAVVLETTTDAKNTPAINLKKKTS